VGCNTTVQQRFTAVWGFCSAPCGSLFYSEDGSSILLWNISILIPGYTASHITEGNTPHNHCHENFKFDNTVVQIMQNCDTSHTSCGTETWVMWWTPLWKKEFIFILMGGIISWHKCIQWGTNFYTNILTNRKRLHPVVKIFLYLFFRSKIMSASTASTDQLKMQGQPNTQQCIQSDTYVG
jgi:hypothetical protein